MTQSPMKPERDERAVGAFVVGSSELRRTRRHHDHRVNDR